MKGFPGYKPQGEKCLPETLISAQLLESNRAWDVPPSSAFPTSCSLLSTQAAEMPVCPPAAGSPPGSRITVFQPDPSASPGSWADNKQAAAWEKEGDVRVRATKNRLKFLKILYMCTYTFIQISIFYGYLNLSGLIRSLHHSNSMKVL